VGEECGTLFLIGPRRYGKTSILRAAEAKLTDAGKVVLRYDAEAFDDVGTLAAALLAGAVRKYSTALDRAQAIAKKFFMAMKPSLTLDPSDQARLAGLEGAFDDGIPGDEDTIGRLVTWADSHLPEIDAARAAYDAKRPPQ